MLDTNSRIRSVLKRRHPVLLRMSQTLINRPTQDQDRVGHRSGYPILALAPPNRSPVKVSTCPTRNLDPWVLWTLEKPQGMSTNLHSIQSGPTLKNTTTSIQHHLWPATDHGQPWILQHFLFEDLGVPKVLLVKPQTYLTPCCKCNPLVLSIPMMVGLYLSNPHSLRKNKGLKPPVKI